MKQQCFGRYASGRDDFSYLGSNIPGRRLIFGLLAIGSAVAELLRRTLACALPEPIELERRLRGIWLQPKEARKALLQSISYLVGRTRLTAQNRPCRVSGTSDRPNQDANFD